MSEDRWKGYGLVLTVAVVVAGAAVLIRESDLSERIEARDTQREEIVRALEEIKSSLRELELRVQGKAIDMETLDPNDEKAMDRAAELLGAEPDPDARFDEIQAAIDEMDRILSRYKDAPLP